VVIEEPARPDPEDLLRRYGLAMKRQVGTRGKLRVYLGAAPGVGKTFTMLNEGRRLKSQGHDVVAGFIETHGRAETEVQIGDLEVIPRKQVPYRGVTVEEMDTDAILRRKPEIALIDELAHTNAPGSPRETRWEDVEVLRKAGIDVITTLNIQHLEGLNDIVASITGVQVRETIPDRLLDDATEVQLVDLPVEGLIERLEQGKIYPSERARQALEHFFREGNLTALRELALRRTAAGVDERLESYMREHEIEDAWPATERIVVLIEDDTSAGTVLRNAWRLASGLRGELVAVAILPPGGFSTSTPEFKSGIERNMALAEDLGASSLIVESDDLGAKLAEVVQEQHGTLVVLPHRPAKRWTRITGRSLVDQLMERLENVDIHLVEAKPRK
jgi:two-component system sensor histidine kinase KdpD